MTWEDEDWAIESEEPTAIHELDSNTIQPDSKESSTEERQVEVGRMEEVELEVDEDPIEDACKDIWATDKWAIEKLFDIANSATKTVALKSWETMELEDTGNRILAINTILKLRWRFDRRIQKKKKTWLKFVLIDDWK